MSTEVFWGLTGGASPHALGLFHLHPEGVSLNTSPPPRSFSAPAPPNPVGLDLDDASHDGAEERRMTIYYFIDLHPNNFSLSTKYEPQK